jgi:hypothetical protein
LGSDIPKRAIKTMNSAYAAVGAIATAWSSLERSLDDIIWTLAGVQHDAGACITSKLSSAHNRIQVLVALVELNGGDDKLLKVVNKALSPEQKISKKRNRAVHDAIGYYVDRKMVVVQRGDVEGRVLEMDLNPFIFEEYDLIKKEIEEFHASILSLRETIYDALPSLTEKRGARPLPNPLRRRPRQTATDI